MVGIHGIALLVGMSALPFFCDDAKKDAKDPADLKVLARADAGLKTGEVVKISADSITVKVHDQVMTGSGKKARPKDEVKEHTYPIEEKAKVKFTKTTKDPLPKIDEIAVGEKITMHMISVKTKDSDNKIDFHLAVKSIDLTPKPPVKDTATTPATTTPKP